MRVFEDVGGAVGGPDRNVVLDAARRDLFGGHARGPVGHNAVDLVAARRPLGQGGEARVLGQVRAIHGPAQAAKVGIGSGHNADEQAVGRRVVVERRRGGQPVALALTHNAQLVVARQRPFENAQHRAVERGVDDVAAVAGPIPSVECGHRGEGGKGSGEVVRNRHAGPHWRPIGFAGEVEEPAEGDAQTVQPGTRGVGARLSENADAHVDQVRGEVVGAEAPPLHGAGPEVLAEHVRRRHQALEQLLALGLAEVAGDTAPAPPLDRPEQ